MADLDFEAVGKTRHRPTKYPDHEFSGRNSAVCQAESPSGYKCTRKRGHTGHHEALIATNAAVAIWTDDEEEGD